MIELPLYGLCPFWEEESTYKLTMKCGIGDIVFNDKKLRRLIVYPYCAGNYKECSFYKAQMKDAEKNGE